MDTWQHIAIPVARAAISREQARHVALLADEVRQGDLGILSFLQVLHCSEHLRNFHLLHLQVPGIMSLLRRAGVRQRLF